MIHTLITMALAALAWPFGLHAEAAFLVASFYTGREHAQAEYRTIYTNYGRKRANAPWWCGFEPRAWDIKSLLDWLGPLMVAAALIGLNDWFVYAR